MGYAQEIVLGQRGGTTPMIYGAMNSCHGPSAYQPRNVAVFRSTGNVRRWPIPSIGILIKNDNCCEFTRSFICETVHNVRNPVLSLDGK